MVVNVEVRFLGIFQRLSGKKRLKLKLEEPATVRGVIMKLKETFSSEFKQALLDSELVDPRPGSLILVGGKEISVLQGLDSVVGDAEEVVLIPMVHGG
jgi:molybdopterin converting factor small subunit